MCCIHSPYMSTWCWYRQESRLRSLHDELGYDNYTKRCGDKLLAWMRVPSPILPKGSFRSSSPPMLRTFKQQVSHFSQFGPTVPCSMAQQVTFSKSNSTLGVYWCRGRSYFSLNLLSVEDIIPYPAFFLASVTPWLLVYNLPRIGPVAQDCCVQDITITVWIRTI